MVRSGLRSNSKGSSGSIGKAMKKQRWRKRKSWIVVGRQTSASSFTGPWPRFLSSSQTRPQLSVFRRSAKSSKLRFRDSPKSLDSTISFTRAVRNLATPSSGQIGPSESGLNLSMTTDLTFRSKKSYRLAKICSPSLTMLTIYPSM